YAVFTIVDGQLQSKISDDGVESFILQFVGSYLVADSDASTFMTSKIDDDALTFLRDPTHALLELTTAVASLRPEHVPCQTFGMDPYKRREARVPIQHEREVLGVIQEGTIGVADEVSVRGWHTRLGHARDQLLRTPPVSD